MGMHAMQCKKKSWEQFNLEVMQHFLFAYDAYDSLNANFNICQGEEQDGLVLKLIE